MSLASGTQFNLKGFQVIPAGDRLIVEMPGGGGYGDPFERDPLQVARDVKYELIDVEQAGIEYGVVLDAAGEVEVGATAARRSGRA